MKRPAFQFYAADWRKDAALQSCSLAAQGLWINAMCIAHECDPYGHLSVNGNAMTHAQLARLVGVSPRECDKLMTELNGAGVPSRADDGAIYSRRMVRDEELRNMRALCGKLGGNPSLLGDKVNQKDKQKVNQIPTPSSSSSSSINQIPLSADADPWLLGKEFLIKRGVTESTVGGFLGKLVKDHGKENVVQALQAAIVNEPADVKGYIVGALRGKTAKFDPVASNAAWLRNQQ